MLHYSLFKFISKITFFLTKNIKRGHDFWKEKVRGVMALPGLGPLDLTRLSLPPPSVPCVCIYICVYFCVCIYIYIYIYFFFFFCRSYHEGYVLGNKVSGVNLNRATKWCAMWRIGSVIPCNCSWSKALSLECHIRFGSWNGNFLTNQ